MSLERHERVDSTNEDIKLRHMPVSAFKGKSLAESDVVLTREVAKYTTGNFPRKITITYCCDIDNNQYGRMAVIIVSMLF